MTMTIYIRKLSRSLLREVKVKKGESRYAAYSLMPPPYSRPRMPFGGRLSLHQNQSLHWNVIGILVVSIKKNSCEASYLVGGSPPTNLGAYSNTLGLTVLQSSNTHV